MLVILHPDDSRAVADAIAADLTTAYSTHVNLRLASYSVPGGWPVDPSWDDLLLVLFNRTPLPDACVQLITPLLSRGGAAGMTIPVALDRDYQRPPSPVDGIKSLVFDGDASGPTGRLARRVGAVLGLRVQARRNRIFISYRASDGAAIAAQLHGHFRSLGYDPWLDEAREVDGDAAILPGSPVQREIDAALAEANSVLLVDTPDAPRSRWIEHEVETANSYLVPILPLCFRAAGDRTQGPRFRSLLELQRWVSLPLQPAGTALPLPDLDQVVSEVESYLMEIFRRKCRVPFLVEHAFTSRRFKWQILDARLLMFGSEKRISWRLKLKVLSHCSIFERVYAPALRKLTDFFDTAGRPNHSLFIYDGELMPEPQLKEVAEADGGRSIILHHQELAALIDSNFTNLPA